MQKLIKCKLCNDSGIKPSEKYFKVMEVCSCNQVERLPRGGLRIDISKTPDWFRRDCVIFKNSILSELSEEDEY